MLSVPVLGSTTTVSGPGVQFLDKTPVFSFSSLSLSSTYHKKVEVGQGNDNKRRRNEDDSFDPEGYSYSNVLIVIND